MSEQSNNRNWLAVLREACADSTQSAIARRLGVSTAQISQALAGKYKGDLSRLQMLVEGHLLNKTVRCPVVGECEIHKCEEHQLRDRRFATANPLFVRLYRACRSGCPNSKLPREY